jgi:hypothetical protein
MKIIIEEREKYEKKLEQERENAKQERETLNKKNNLILLENTKLKVLLEQNNSKPTKIINNINNINNGNLSYLNTHYNNVAPLKTIEFKDFVNKPKTDDKVISKMIKAFNRNELHKELGDLLVENYCHEDKSKQSIWSIDVARLKYMIREHFEPDIKKNKKKKKDEWVSDDGATKVKSVIIKPLLDYVASLFFKKSNNLNMQTIEAGFLKKIMKEYNSKDKNFAYDKYVGSQYQSEAVNIFKDDYLPQICLLKEIYSSCKNNDLEVKICKYITPFFKITKQKILIINNDNIEYNTNIENDINYKNINNMID